MKKSRFERSTQFTMRVPALWLEIAEATAEGMTELGVRQSRSDVLRMAMIRGLGILGKELKAAHARDEDPTDEKPSSKQKRLENTHGEETGSK